MLSPGSEPTHGPVFWQDIGEETAIDIACEFSFGGNPYGEHWNWAFEYNDGEEIPFLFEELRRLSTLREKHVFAVKQIASMVMVSCPKHFSNESFELAIQIAIAYLAAPTPWFSRGRELHVILAFSAHALLDLRGFLEMQKSFALKEQQMPELPRLSA